MKAIVFEQYGGPEVLTLKDIPKPTPKENEVLIKVHAVSLNDWDYGMLGDDLFNRMLTGFSKPRIQILGSDVAGVVESVGMKVTKFTAGDAVYGDLSGKWGGFAEYVVAQENKLAIKPVSMTFEQAAAIPQAAMLTVQGLLDKGKLHAGQKVLVNGAGGGVGTFAIQIAKLYNVEMTGVDNSSKLELMKSMGYDHVIDYTKEDFTKNGKEYDLILDTKTNRSMFAYARALRPEGKYVTVGGEMSRVFQILLLSPIAFLFSKKKFALVMLRPNKDLALMNKLFEDGSVRPIIDGPYKLEDVPHVFRVFGQGLHKGKIVFSVN
jgi:NADPH:quinone reductase-like Zn-dependent oxidoreductase